MRDSITAPFLQISTGNKSNFQLSKHCKPWRTKTGLTAWAHLQPNDGHIISATRLSFFVERVEMFACNKHDTINSLRLFGDGWIGQHWSEAGSRPHVV